MARPRVNEDQRIWAYRLYVQGFGPTYIHASLEREFSATGVPVSIRTVKGWVGGFKKIGHEVTMADEPFKWELMDGYGIPWSGSEYLLRYWRAVNHRYHRFTGRSPSGRDMRWASRVHDACPELSTDEVLELSQQFVARELFKDILGEDLGTGDLWARLAYKPWAGDQELEDYQAAVAAGEIPELKSTYAGIGAQLWSSLMDLDATSVGLTSVVNRLSEAGDPAVLIEQKDFIEDEPE